ncbi:MAG TPA: ribose-phosphate pyrophosphokinase [Anaerolineae bacterium]|nr:ribose-phosphate pyrophosphokinase [Anaerolineae bacterium]
MRSMYGELAIFSGNANRPLAEEICQYLGVSLRGADVFQFPNENIFVRLHGSVRSQDVFLIQPTCSPVNDNIMELLIFMDCLRRDSAGRITAVVPYYAYGRTDKKDQPRVPITARLIADLITVAGADRFLTIDLHAGQIQGFFTIPVDEITAFHMLSEYFIKKGVENAVVIAPDVGASKRARNFAQELGVPLAIVEKRRGDRECEALSLIGEVRGRNAIIFDDEIDTAETLVKAAHFVREEGAREIYACATHPVFSPPAEERLRGADLTELVVTNTIPVPEEKRLPNMTILSVGPLLGEVIRRIHLGLSVGEMFNE